MALSVNENSSGRLQLHDLSEEKSTSHSSWAKESFTLSAWGNMVEWQWRLNEKSEKRSWTWVDKYASGFWALTSILFNHLSSMSLDIVGKIYDGHGTLRSSTILDRTCWRLEKVSFEIDFRELPKYNKLKALGIIIIHYSPGKFCKCHAERVETFTIIGNEDVTTMWEGDRKTINEIVIHIFEWILCFV